MRKKKSSKRTNKSRKTPLETHPFMDFVTKYWNKPANFVVSYLKGASLFDKEDSIYEELVFLMEVKKLQG